MVVVVVIVVVEVASACPPACPYQPGAQRDHQQPRTYLQRRYQDVRQDVLAGEERQQADGDDRGGVGEGDDTAQGGGVFSGTATADQISGDQGLAVTRCQGVQPAEQRRQAQTHNEQPRRQRGLVQVTDQPLLPLRDVRACVGGVRACVGVAAGC